MCNKFYHTLFFITPRKTNGGACALCLAECPHRFTTVASRLGWFHTQVDLDAGNKDIKKILILLDCTQVYHHSKTSNLGVTMRRFRAFWGKVVAGYHRKRSCLISLYGVLRMDIF